MPVECGHLTKPGQAWRYGAPGPGILLDDGRASPRLQPQSACGRRLRLLEREAAAEAKGEAKAILKVLEARGIAVSEAQREEVLRCHDLDRLDRWLRRAALASSTAEITAEP